MGGEKSRGGSWRTHIWRGRKGGFGGADGVLEKGGDLKKTGPGAGICIVISTGRYRCVAGKTKVPVRTGGDAPHDTLS